MKRMVNLREKFNSAFWKWFGKSKAVDRQGKPLIVYHGSDRKLDVITPGYHEPGAWFTTNIRNASSYVKGAEGTLHSCFLSVQNPMVIPFEWEGGELVPKIGGLSLEDLEEMYLDNNVALVKYAKSLGHDGVHFPDGNYSEEDETWVVFSESQIKSIDNRGTWDPRNPNIYEKKD